MKSIVVAAVLIALASPVALASAAWAQEIGARLTFCASCHGAQGVPHDNDVPIIWGQQAAYLAKQLRDYRGGDRENQIMSSVAESLSDAEITALAADFAARSWPVTGTAPPGSLPGAATVCQSCHQANFAGGEVPGIGAVPRLAGQQPVYLRGALADYASGQRSNSAVMPAIAKALSADDRAALGAALGKLDGK